MGTGKRSFGPPRNPVGQFVRRNSRRHAQPLQAGTVGGFGRLDHRREHVLLSILPGHPALNDRGALLLHSDLDSRESGARQLPLELRDGGGACDSCALRLRGGERGGHRVVAELHDVRVADPPPCSHGNWV